MILCARKAIKMARIAKPSRITIAHCWSVHWLRSGSFVCSVGVGDGRGSGLLVVKDIQGL